MLLSPWLETLLDLAEKVPQSRNRLCVWAWPKHALQWKPVRHLVLETCYENHLKSCLWKSFEIVKVWRTGVWCLTLCRVSLKWSYSRRQCSQIALWKRKWKLVLGGRDGEGITGTFLVVIYSIGCGRLLLCRIPAFYQALRLEYKVLHRSKAYRSYIPDSSVPLMGLLLI